MVINLIMLILSFLIKQISHLNTGAHFLSVYYLHSFHLRKSKFQYLPCSSYSVVAHCNSNDCNVCNC